MTQSDPITVSITRVVKPGHEAEFERAMHEFAQRSLALPGQLGVHVLRPAAGSSSREYGVVRKFADREALVAFRASPEYLAWNKLAAELTEGAARTEELTGLETWFTAPGAPLLPLPKWKMAVATLLGVYPTSLLLAATLGEAVHQWPVVLRSLVFAVGMVPLLTWVVMPVVTRSLHGWLHKAT